jgi:small subunit ribosomal protein S20
MANTASAAKAARKTKKRQAVNSARKSRVRTHVRAVEDALAKGDAAAAATALKAAEPEIQRGANKGVMHQNAASRKISRLTKRVKAAAQA